MMLRLTIAAAALMAAAEVAQAADRERGQALYAQCIACHSLDGENGVGPTLKGVIGRRAGSLPDFRYSPAMRRATLVWDPAAIERFMDDPQSLVRGNRMPFSGVEAAQDRADIAAYLEEAGK